MDGALGPRDLAVTIDSHLSTSNHNHLKPSSHNLQSPWYVSSRMSYPERQDPPLTSVPVCTKLGWNPNAARRRLDPPNSVDSPTYPHPQAEREAQKIVQQAIRPYLTTLPTDRTKRVKDARSEAQKEIDEYRNKKEEEFKQFSTQHTSGNEQAEKDASKDTDEKLKEIKSIGDKEGSTVVDNLLRAVTDVKPQVPDRVEQPVA
ncbi:hypothetical protein E4T49_07686 [Aureobasidium sp. EXF-10728]|nr:hypothetical protein E4T49_07686 [Aureobasidium sp. EXF-10728]